MRRGKPAGSAAEESGEGYLASVSDLMAGLIFIFVITLAVFALQLAQTMEEQELEFTSAQNTREKILRDIQDRLRLAGISVEILLEQGVLRLSEKGIRFESGKEAPKPEHEARVGELARVLAEVLPCYAKPGGPIDGAKGERPDHCAPVRDEPEAYECDPTKFPARLETLLIEGHTDSEKVVVGERFHNNLELSAMRAARVQQMMLACEPRLGQLKNLSGLEIVSVSGYGESRLATPLQPTSEENRRIDLRFLMELPRAARALAGRGSESQPSANTVSPAEEVDARYQRDGI